MVKKIIRRFLNGDKHVWGWVTLDISNPLPDNHQALAV